MKRFAASLAVAGLLAGCAAYDPIVARDLDRSRLPQPDRTLEIAGLGPCTDNLDRRLLLKSGQPVTLLVHGCFGSRGQFRALAQVLAFQGQQSACFTYDDRAALDEVAMQLRNAVGQLADQSGAGRISVIGHSQGALIARRAMTRSLTGTDLPANSTDLQLVTISGPFSGIAAARTCGRAWLYPLTLGLLPLACHAVTGAKWADITFSSRFIVEPGQLSPNVNYLKIDTDEQGSCRRRDEGGRCRESDDIFSLAEQRNALVESDPRVDRVEIDAGHVEIVGDKVNVPTKLIAVLQDKGVLRPVNPAQRAEFSRMLAETYRNFVDAP
ncbi:MAG: hypothetical protein ABI564_08825 [Ideonella sp.]